MKNFHLHSSKFDIPFNLFYYVKRRVVLQRETTSRKKNEINIRVVQEVATHIGT
jgi:hypothetical protein